MLRGKMEIFIFALIASYNAHRQQERVVVEPEELQLLDLQALRNFVNAQPVRISSRFKLLLNEGINISQIAADKTS